MAASPCSLPPHNWSRRCPCCTNCWASDTTLVFSLNRLNHKETAMKRQLTTLALMLAAAGLASQAAHAQVKIGFITDMSSLYSDVEGKGGATAIQMAIDDFGGKVLGQSIELL